MVDVLVVMVTEILMVITVRKQWPAQAHRYHHVIQKLDIGDDGEAHGDSWLWGKSEHHKGAMAAFRRFLVVMVDLLVAYVKLLWASQVVIYNRGDLIWLRSMDQVMILVNGIPVCEMVEYQNIQKAVRGCQSLCLCVSVSVCQ